MPLAICRGHGNHDRHAGHSVAMFCGSSALVLHFRRIRPALVAGWQLHSPCRRLSREKGPAPRRAIARSPTIMQKSVRPSCIAAQKPCLSSNGALVVVIATRITVSKGQTAKIGKRPRIKKVPQKISVAKHERPHELRSGNTDLLQATCTKRSREKELLDDFGEEDPADKKSKQERAPSDSVRRYLFHPLGALPMRMPAAKYKRIR